ncbi:MAG TPA: error-prone DNA polymerase, partial [Defluviicoccus sp.]|nr:error-prone DNA polymerase [Defluviicoccus sp.]
FYAPAQIIADARRHGVPVLPADVNASDWDCTLEPASAGGPALRLGFRQIKGLREAEARAITAGRNRPFASIAELAARAGLAPRTLETLARADAFGSLKLDRRRALWAVLGLEEEPLPLFAPLFAGAGKVQEQEPAVALPPAPLGEEVSDDYQAFGLSLKAHPVALLRPRLDTEGYLPAARIAALKHEDRVKTAGLVITRQSPGSAKGIIFITLEDETGQANLIVKPVVFARHRGTVLGAQMIGVEGRVQRQGAVVHVLARRLVTLDPVLTRLSRHIAPNLTPSRAGDEARFEVCSRDFH